jgi:hypothetical protein
MNTNTQNPTKRIPDSSQPQHGAGSGFLKFNTTRSKRASCLAVAIVMLWGFHAFAAPQASLTLKNGDAALCNGNDTEWSLDKTGVYDSGNKSVTWTVNATKGSISNNILVVNGYLAVQNTGSANATIGNIVVNLQRQKNIGTPAKPKWIWASASVDVADATQGDAATSAKIVAAASQEIPAYSGGDYAITGTTGIFTQNAASGLLSFIDQDSNTIWAITPQKVIPPGATVNLLFTAEFNNTLLKIPAGEIIRPEVIVSFGNVGPRGGSGASASNIDVNGNGVIDPDESGVRSVPTRLSRAVPMLEGCNSQVTLADTGVTTTGDVTFDSLFSDIQANPEVISQSTSFTVTATGVDGGVSGGYIENEASLSWESSSVSVIIGYDISTQLPIYYDFACCEGLNLTVSSAL